MVRSRFAVALAAGAAFAMIATPALARGYGGWHGGHSHRHHRDGLDGGDLLAGLLIVGGVVAIASAVSKSSRDRQDRPAPDHDPDGSYYGGDSRDAPRAGQNRQGDRFDDAANTCADEVERGERRVDSIDGVSRTGDRYSVAGRLEDGRDFACSIDDTGQVRSIAVDGRGVI